MSSIELRENYGKTIIINLELENQRQEKLNLPYISIEEVSKHNSYSDCWIIIDYNVYDITKFIDKHPGGILPLSHSAGHDVTDLFTEYHPANVWIMMREYQIGRIDKNKSGPLTEFAKDRRLIRQKLLADNLFETDLTYYIYKLSACFMFFIVSVILLLYSNTITETNFYFKSSDYHNASFLSNLFMTLSDSLAYVCNVAFFRTIAAICLGLFWQQMAFIGHDCGHNGIFHNLDIESIVGLFVGNFFTGISIGWWKRSHNVHHIVCNSVEHDPDIQHLPFIAISDKIFAPSTYPSESLISPATVNSLETVATKSPKGMDLNNKDSKYESKYQTIKTGKGVLASILDGVYYSTYHQRFIPFDSVARFLVQYQHFIYYPLMAVARFNLYAQSWILLLAPPQKQMVSSLPFSDKERLELLNPKTEGDNVEINKWRNWEIVSLVGFFCWLVVYLAYLLPNAYERFKFVMISHAIAGILHVQITLSHFACDVFRGSAFEHPDDWFKIQLYTSMNVDTNWLTHWFHGGLQSQIEHHLFPRLPRHNLSKAKELIVPFCEKHNIPYLTMSFWDANCLVISSLYKAALKVKDSKHVDLSSLSNGWNAIG